MTRGAAFVVIAAGVGVISACGGASKDHVLRILDPSGHAAPALTNADFVRSSARAVNVSGSWAVNVELKKHGALKFHRLTRALARRGARLHRRQVFALEVDGRVYSRVAIDYRAFPDGLNVGSDGLEFVNVPADQARLLAETIRGS